MTKTEFEQVLKDQGYDLIARFGNNYWHKEFYPTYVVNLCSVIVLRDEDGKKDGHYFLEER